MSKEFPVEKLNLNTDRFVTDAEVAKSLVDSVQSKHAKLWDLIKLMEEHIDGKKPRDPDKLKSSGQSWTNNWNFGKARSKIEKVSGANVDTVLNAMLLMSVDFKPIDDKVKKDKDIAFLEMPDLKDYASNAVEACVNNLIENDSRFMPFVAMMEYCATAWGWSSSVKDIRHDYLGAAQHIRSIGFTEKVRPDQPRDFITFDTIDGKELWTRYSDIKDSENLELITGGNNTRWRQSPSGWILEGLEESLFFAYNGMFDKDKAPRGELTDFGEDILPEFMKSPSIGMMRTNSINVAKLVNFEMEQGKVTFSIVAYGNGWKGETKNGKVVRYRGGPPPGINESDQNPKYMLYQRTVKIESNLDVIDIVLDSGFSTNGMLQDMKGLARHAVEDGIRYNRNMNDLLDKLKVSGAALMEPNNQMNGRTAPRIAPHGGFLISDGNYALAPNQPKFDLSNHIAMLNIEESNYTRETENFDPNVSGKLTSRPVTREVEVVSGEVRRIEGTKAAIKLKCWGRVVLGIIRGLAYHLDKPADSTIEENLEANRCFETFKERLKEHLSVVGIDTDAKLKKLLDHIESVQLVSVLSDPQAIIEQISMAEKPYDRIKFNRMLMIARGFSRRDVVQRWPLLEMPTNMMDEWMAAQENIAFQTSAEVVFSPSHNHIAHLNTHFPKCFALIEQIMQVPDPVESFNWLNRLVEHSGFHVDALLKTQYIEEATKSKYLSAYKQLLTAIKQLKGQIEEMARKLAEQQAAAEQAQQGQQQIDPKVQAQIENDRIKLANNQELKKAQSEFRAQEMAKSNEQRRQHAEETHQEKIRRTRELEELKKDVTLLKESIKMSAA